MEVDAYVQARYGRLLEHAVELGAPEGQAAAYVDEVLLQQRRHIRRADDPDPVVREALGRAIRGERAPSRSWIAIALVLVVVAVVGLAAILVDPAPRPLPSLFGYQAREAEARLTDAGWDVQLRVARACEPQDLVIGTTPPAGTLVAEGEPVSVRVAVPYAECLAQYQRRADAWDFVRFARGLAPAPGFASTVSVVIDDGEADELSREQAGRPQSWGTTLDLVADAADTPAPTRNGMPSLTVTEGVPPATYCGVDRPTAAGERPALRLAIDPAPDDQTSDCPLSVDLYRSAGGIDAVVVYTAVTDATP